MPTPMHPDPSRATGACVTWHTISWDPKKSICCGWSRFFSTLFLCRKKTLGSPPPCSCVRGNGMIQRLRWPHLLRLLGACGRGRGGRKQGEGTLGSEDGPCQLVGAASLYPWLAAWKTCGVDAVLGPAGLWEPDS